MVLDKSLIINFFNSKYLNFKHWGMYQINTETCIIVIN